MISVEHLTKYYGDHLAVDDLSFTIEQGHVYGFLGANGAGKSTTMNIMTGCLSASGGTVTIDGFDIFDQPKEAKRLLGYLPEQPPLYQYETPLDYLRFVGKAKGVWGGVLEAQIDEVIRQTGIESVKTRRISQLSKGYRQRVGIAQALLGDPKVIILDEPTVGLDPIQIIEIRELIRELGKSHTVILSSHILSEVQSVCDRILMIAHGKLVAFGAPEELEQQLLSAGRIELLAASQGDKLRNELCRMEHITALSIEQLPDGHVSATVETDHSDIYEMSAAIFKACVANNIVLLEMRVQKANLEAVFLELAGGVDIATTATKVQNDMEQEVTEE